jgi:hypothetical protein
MSEISVKDLVRAPLASADQLLNAFFAAHPAPNGDGARVTLRAAEMAQPAIVALSKAHRPDDMTPRYAVHWEAEAGGPFPVFDGELTIGADEDYSAFWLVLNGAYEPPGGVAGKVFDAVLGHRIAESTAAGLLAEMRADIENRFFAQEQAKKA